MRSSRSTEDEITKLSRNDLCHCGSGKKYKKCHLAADDAARTAELAAKNAALAEAAREAAEKDPEGTALKEEALKEDLTKAAASRAAKPALSTPSARQARRRGVA